MSILHQVGGGGRGGVGGTACAGMAALAVFTQEVMSYLRMRVTPPSLTPPLPPAQNAHFSPTKSIFMNIAGRKDVCRHR